MHLVLFRYVGGCGGRVFGVCMCGRGVVFGVGGCGGRVRCDGRVFGVGGCGRRVFGVLGG